MCGRMTLTRSGNEIAAYFAEIMTETTGAGELSPLVEPDGHPLRPRYNISPSQEIATVLLEEGAGLRLDWKIWGLVPSWSKQPDRGGRLFNARSETVAEKPSFRSAFKHRRCLIPADGFYEWTPRNRGHEPFYFTATGAPMLVFAGLFEVWHGDGGEVIDSCTLLTTDSNPDLADVHHRMPVTLTAEGARTWLDPSSAPDALVALTAPPPAGTLTRRAVARTVNDPRHEGPECLEPPPKKAQPDLFELDGGG